MRDDIRVILVLVLSTIVVSGFSLFALIEFGPSGYVVQTINASFVIAETTTSTTSSSTTVTSVVPPPSSGGGGGGGGGGGRTEQVIVDFQILVPDPLTGYSGDTIVAKLILKNGDTDITGISMSAFSNEGLGFVFSPQTVETLKAYEEKPVNLIITTTNVTGTFLINIRADAKEPSVSESAYIFIDLLEKGRFNKTLIVNKLAFTKDLFKENPECLDLNEVLDRAEKAIESGKIDEANNLVDKAVRACRDLVTAKQEDVVEQQPTNNFPKILGIFAGIGLIILIGYEVFRYRSGNKIFRRAGIFIALIIVTVASRFAYTGMATRATGNVLDLVSLKVIIVIDLLLLITYLRLRFTR